MAPGRRVEKETRRKERKQFRNHKKSRGTMRNFFPHSLAAAAAAVGTSYPKKKRNLVFIISDFLLSSRSREHLSI
jgi:hypothetical protein